MFARLRTSTRQHKRSQYDCKQLVVVVARAGPNLDPLSCARARMMDVAKKRAHPQVCLSIAQLAYVSPFLETHASARAETLDSDYGSAVFRKHMRRRRRRPPAAAPRCQRCDHNLFGIVVNTQTSHSSRCWLISARVWARARARSREIEIKRKSDATSAFASPARLAHASVRAPLGKSARINHMRRAAATAAAAAYATFVCTNIQVAQS